MKSQDADKYFIKIQERYDYLDEDSQKLIREAFDLAAQAHVDQKRQSGEPYLMHPAAVSCILLDLKMDAQSIVAGLLHDVIEDTSYNYIDIVGHFGDEVAELVDGVTKLTQIIFETRLEAQAENFRKMLLAMAKDIRVVIIKLADRLHNMRTLGPLNAEKRRRIPLETLDIYAPLAKRLGMHGISLELEELGFSALYPMRYRILSQEVKRFHGDHMSVLDEIKANIKSRLEEKHVTMFDITSREKHVYSIYKKMKKKRLSFAELCDVYAVRVVVGTLDDCYLTLGAIHQLYKPRPEKFKDYIALPKSNGYQSLHTILFSPYGLPIEVQIRTQEMQMTAECGIAAHWTYKSGERSIKDSQLRMQHWLSNLIEIQQKTGNSIEFIENVKINLFPDEVYVFTPKGDIIELPSGATAMDFAYAVHTEVGNSCVAAKVDRQLAPLATVLLNGQTIEIITAQGAHPSPSWLSSVVTARARSAIRYYLKNKKREQSIGLGERLVEAILSKKHIDIHAVSKDRLYEVARNLNYMELDDLFEDVGLGNRSAVLVSKQIEHAVGHYDMSGHNVEERMDISIVGTEGMAVSYAQCCYPIPGDPVEGLMVEGKGLVVHRQSCPKASSVSMHHESVVDVCWSDEIHQEFKSVVTVKVLNQRGVLAMLALAVSDARANIDDIMLENHQEGNAYANVRLALMVKDRFQLANVIRQFRLLKSVIHVERFLGED